MGVNMIMELLNNSCPYCHANLVYDPIYYLYRCPNHIRGCRMIGVTREYMEHLKEEHKNDCRDRSI